MTEAEQLLDIKRRHSRLHLVDKECCVALSACTRMLPICYETGLESELKAVHESIKALHAAATIKWEQGQ